MWKILIVLAAVLYSLSPVDFLPDYILGWGWLDDVAVLFILWQIYVRLKQRLGSYQDGTASGSRHHDNQSGSNRQEETQTQKSPHEILGIPPHATLDEIKHAYRQLAGQYHPDKVSHLGEEFRRLAEKRFKEIQEAYQELTRES